MPSYTAPAKWNSLVMVTKCHDLSITQDLRGISFFLLSNINKMHANWLYIVELRHEVPAKAPSRISEEAVMMAIACNPSYCRGRAGGAQVQTPSEKSRPAQNILGDCLQIKFAGAGNVVAEYIREACIRS